MSEQVIWQRTIDHDKIAHRKQQFLKRFLPLAAAAFLVVLVIAGFRNALGSLIAIAAVGLFWGNVVRYQSLSDQANPTMTFDGTRVQVGNRTIIVEDVWAYTTMATSVQTSILGRHSRIEVGKAVFRFNSPGGRRDPELVEIGWPNMNEAGVEAITAALGTVMGDKWREPLDLVTEDELRARGRRRPGLI